MRNTSLYKPHRSLSSLSAALLSSLLPFCPWNFASLSATNPFGVSAFVSPVPTTTTPSSLSFTRMIRPMENEISLAPQRRQHALRPSFMTSADSSTTPSIATDETTTTMASPPSVVDHSTLTLLEHININVPSQEYIKDFYFRVLGCGMDPRRAGNLAPDAPKKTLWANCGASQFHLPYGDTGQAVRGHTGLRYTSLKGLHQRLRDYPDCYRSFKVLQSTTEGNNDGDEEPLAIRMIDHYGNCLVARSTAVMPAGTTTNVSPDWRQPVLTTGDADALEKWGETVLERYGCQDGRPECLGIDYVENLCPPGTAETIALFYDRVFDATTSVLTVPSEDTEEPLQIAVIAFGKITAEGRSDQSLVFRETREEIPEYDGHHIALYVGESSADFVQAFQNADLANVVWVNPRFSDAATTVATAKKWEQFRFKDIVDLRTGKVVYELEHEVRSVGHSAWVGERGSGSVW